MKVIGTILTVIGTVWLSVELDGCFWEIVAISALIGSGAVLCVLKRGEPDAKNS